MSELMQFDTSATRVGGANVTAAIKSDKKLVFNESYTVMGRKLKAPSVYACYDLTVIGDIEADEIEITGNLLVTGNIKARSVSCLKSLTCGGDIDAETISGNEIVAENIKCRTLTSSGNVIIRSVIDVQESIVSDKSVMTGEGILGSGRFSAKNAVAAEYFEFDGEVEGKVLELETDASFGQPHQLTGEEALTALSDNLSGIISTAIASAGEAGEDNLVQAVAKVSAMDQNIMADWEKLTAKLVELSFFDKITNFRDYLYVVMARKILPPAITEHESFKHIFDDMMADAEQQLDSLEFHAKSVDEVAFALKIISICEADIKIDKDEAYDKISQKLGIKYKTAIKYLR